MSPTAILTLIGLAIKYGPTVVRLAQGAGPVLKALQEAAPEMAGPLKELAREAFPDLPERQALRAALEVITEPNATRRINEERGGD